jgi:hypothetical protein
MIAKLKSALVDTLPPEQLIRLSTLKGKLRRRLDAAMHPDEILESGTGWEQFERGAARLTGAASAIREVRDPRERERLKRTLMERVSFDPVAARLLEESYLRRLFDDDDLYGCALGAARYARGEIESAMEAFSLALEASPSAFNHLFRSRCASHGLRDDARTASILEAALERVPGDFSLTLSLAAAYYRQGDTARANRLLATIQDGLARTVGASDLTAPQLAAELDRALSQRLTVRPKGQSNDQYNEEFSASYWRQLWCAMNGLTRFQHGWSGLDYLFQQQIGRIIEEIAPEVRRVINFGVFCANPDYALALRFPNVAFHGVDREQSVKRLNEWAYPAANLHFHAANVLDVLPELTAPAEPSVLFHARTAVVCYPEFLRTLYRGCADAGVEYIALWENNSLSRTTLRFHDFEAMPADAVPYYSVMFIHDYARLLRESGYEVVHVERRPSNFTLLELDSHLADGHVFVVARRSA